ncbi:hypothetical protein V1514DRAFT_364995 [Lipomyces japonicus]|uniref:uncharacterized protein n=1 Tax=Lipomyces japonicus TaxID=56871 RepID=UPI0034CDB0E9
MRSIRLSGWAIVRILVVLVVLVILFTSPSVSNKGSNASNDEYKLPSILTGNNNFQAGSNPKVANFAEPPAKPDFSTGTGNSDLILEDDDTQAKEIIPTSLAIKVANDVPADGANNKFAPEPAVDEKPKFPETAVEEPKNEKVSQPGFPIPDQAQQDTTASQEKRGRMEIFLINTPRYHFEVVLPFLRAFSSLPDEGSHRFGVAQPYGLQIADSTKLNPNSGSPDLIFLTSCPEDVNNTSNALTAFLERGARASKWDARPDGESPYAKQISYMVPWIEKGQWEVRFVQKNFPTFFETDEIFRVDDGSVTVDSTNAFAAIPGKYEPWRRNYNKIFEQYQQAKPNGKLHLVGSGKKMNVPPQIQSEIFPEYFAHLGLAIMIIPTFASPAYTLHQASSSIASALIVGTPLLVDKNIHAAYSHIPVEAVWQQEEGENEMTAFSRISKLSKDAWLQKKQAVARVRDKMITENKEFFETALQEIWSGKTK